MAARITGNAPSKAVAVVGMALRYPDARDLHEFWANVLARRRAFRAFPSERLSADYLASDSPDHSYARRGAFIDGFEFDWVGHRIPKRMFEGGDVVHWLAYHVALQAVSDSGYRPAELPRERTGVIVGNSLTGEVSRSKALRVRWPFVARAFREGMGVLGYARTDIDELVGVTEEVFKSVTPEFTEDTLPGIMANTIAGQIANLLDLKGGAYSVDGACASSLLAIGQAFDALVDGAMDVALAGGVDVSIDPVELVGFSRLGALASDDMYVYDRRSQGFYPGEGCGWVVLKRLEDAERDGDDIYAVLRGWGMSSDGRGGITAPGLAGQMLAIRRAYEGTGYHLADVDFVEGHGTGTALGDRTELAALADVVQEGGGMRPIGVTSLKATIGHCKAAAGVGSFIKASLAVRQRVIPPLAGCQRPHEGFSGVPVYPLMDGALGDPDAIMRAGVSGFGFGGINVHLTLESRADRKRELRGAIDERALMASAQDSELFCLRGSSPEALRADVEALARVAGRLSNAELTDLAAHLARTLGDGQTRAAVVASEPSELEGKLWTLAHMLAWPPAPGELRTDADEDVWLSSDRTSCRVGFLFPGQGSQRLNMARALVERHPWARDLVASADASAGVVARAPLSTAMFRPLARATDDEVAAWRAHLTRTEVCQPAVCLASVLQATELLRLGVRPTVVAGHSLGELTAFWAAGALSFEELISAACLRGAAMIHTGDGAPGMASLACSAAGAEKLCAEVATDVDVANLNSDRETVVSGDADAVDEVVRRAVGRGIAAQRLRVANAFHSRYVEHARERLAGHSGLPEVVPNLSARLFSAVDCTEIQSASPLRAHLARQVTEQVDFVGLAATVAAGVDLLIEVGPGKTLSRLIADIEAADGARCIPLEPQPGTFISYNRALAAYFTLGGDLDTAALHDQRLVRPYVSPDDRRFIRNPCEEPFRKPEVPETFHRVHKRGVEAWLAERTGLKGVTIGSYLQRRGGFLADVVRADLKADPGADTSAVADEATTPLAPGPTELSNEQARAPAGTLDGGMAAASAKAGNQAAAAGRGPTAGGGSGDGDPELVLIDLIVQRTGFPAESITPDMRLLNDLNIESIAATEIVTRAFVLAGGGVPNDPGALFEASIREIANAIRHGRTTITQDGAPRPAARPGKGERILDVLERLNDQPTWLRTFDARLSEEPAPPVEPEERAEALRSRKVRVLAEAAADPRAAAIAEACEAAGCADVEVRRFADGHGGWEEVADVVVAVLPGPAPELDTPREFMACLLAAFRAVRAGGTLTYLQFGEGVFGTRPELVDGLPQSAGAFAASVHHERPDLRLRVIDAPAAAAPATLATWTVDETVRDDSFARVGRDARGVRRIPRPHIAGPVVRTAARLDMSADDVVLATGGGKGITVELALRLAQETGVRLAILGRSDPSQDTEVTDSLLRLDEANVTYRYLRCDITDRDAVIEAVAQARAKLGPITAVLHGAGINRFTRVGDETVEEAAPVVDVKVGGLARVLDALKDNPPRLVLALSSIIGVTGMPRNAWYALANETLDLLLPRYRHTHPGTRVLSVAYSLWDGKGMAREAGVTDTLRRMGTSAIPVEEASRRFLTLLADGSAREHVVVTGRIGGLDTWCPDLDHHPHWRFLEEILSVQPHVELVARARLSLERDPYLRDHVYKGTCLFPMVFGLEAMAQAVAAAIGRRRLAHVRLEDVELRQPITVDGASGEEILVHVEVEEPDGSGDVRAAAGIACGRTGFHHDHFRATFVLPTKDLPPVEHRIDRPATPLPLDPASDVYGRFLFHGPAFQRLKDFFVLRSDYAVFTATHDPAEALSEFILGDPYFRDALLQAGQVAIPRDRALPRRIKCLEIHEADGPLPAQPVIEGTVTEKTPETIDCTVVVTDGEHRVLQRLDGCQFSIIDHLAAEPTAEDVADPTARDQRLLDQLRDTAADLDVRLPALVVERMRPTCGAEMVNIGEEELVKRARALHQMAENDQVDSQAAVQPAPVAVATDGRYRVAAAGVGPHGLALETVASRSEQEWAQSLDAAGLEVAHWLAGEEEADRAATRVLAALQSLGHADALEVVRRQGEVVVLSAQVGAATRSVLTAPITFTLGAQRMLAVQVAGGAGRVDPGARNRGPASLGMGNDAANRQFVMRWPAAFKHIANLDGTVYFTAYADWMGTVREAALQPIAAQLAAHLQSGRWGMVTNFSEFSIGGELRLADTIEGRCAVHRVPGSETQSIDLAFEWHRCQGDGTGTHVASGRMRATWVEILEHGAVRPARMPDYFQDFVDTRARPAGTSHSGDLYPARTRFDDLGALQFEQPDGPARGPAVGTLTFETCLQDANLVGNIYFANYYVWQARVVESYLHGVIPDAYRTMGGQGQLCCVAARVDHLVDVMPFEQIAVIASLSALRGKAVTFAFDYFRMRPDGTKQKVAHGRQDCVWLTAPYGVAAPLPEPLASDLWHRVAHAPDQKG